MRERIPEGFSFSQTGLNSFDDCRRQFFLRYVRGLRWPAALTSSDRWEEALRRGQRFHQWVQQEALGMELGEEVGDCGDPLLQEWWRNYRSRPELVLPAGTVYSEMQLIAPMGRFRLLARFDRLVFAEDGRVKILDWKTGRKRPEQKLYEESWQTLVYRYVLVESGGVLSAGGGIDPGEVSLVYWHAQYPELPGSIPYSADEHRLAGGRLQEVVDRIGGLNGEADFPQTDDIETCRRCPYRSYCRIDLAPIDDPEGEWEIDAEDLDWEQIPEAEL